jgi:hypothetical protein
VIADSSVQDLDKLLSQAKGIHSRFEPVWYLNLAYYMGEQWLYWNRGRLDRPKLDPSRVRLVDNRIIGIVRQEVARLTKQRPTWTSVPKSGDDDDVQASLVAEKVAEFLWVKQDMDAKLARALLWSRITCAGFWKIIWDSSKGDKFEIVVDNSGNPVLDENGGPRKPSDFMSMPPELSRKAVCTGDVHIEVRSPFQIFPDPIAETLTDAEWLIEESVHSTEYVKVRYGVEVEPDTDIAPGPTESRLFPSFQLGGGTGYRGVRLREYWAKPSSVHPNGRRAVWARGKLLTEGDNTYGKLPYIMFTAIPVPGRFWGTSIVEQLRGPQTELNKVKSQITENSNRLGNPALLASRQANIQYQGVPGERIDFDDTVPNAIPTYLQAPELPGYVIQQQDRLEQSFQEISGQHEVSSGMVPAGVKAASAISLLQEADDTRLGPAVADMERTVGLGGTMVLELVGRYYTDERMMVLTGPDNALSVTPFRGAMLKGNTTIEVQTGSMFPQSKSQRQAAISDALNLRMQYGGEPVDPQLMRKVIADYGAGAVEKLWGDLEGDIRQINRENQQLNLGMPLDINSYDNDQAHITGHEDFQKTANYQRLDPQAKNNTELHVAAHRERLLQSMAPQQPLPGLGGPPGMMGPPGSKGPPEGGSAPPNGQPMPSSSPFTR